MRDDFTDRSRFARAGRAGDVDTGAGSGGDSSFEMFVDRGEFSIAAREERGNGGDVKGRASNLEGGSGGVGWGEDAGAEWGEFEWFLDDDSDGTLAFL